MAALFRKTTTRPAPEGAELFTRKGKRFARWKDRSGKTRTAPVVCDAQGVAVLGKGGRPRIRVKSGTVYAKLRIGGVVREIATGCRTEDGARAVLSDLSKRAEHIRAGIMTSSEARTADYQTTALSVHVDSYGDHLAAKGCIATHRKDVCRRLRLLADECGFGKLRDLDRDTLESWLVKQTAGGMSARTRNGYGAAAVSFANWCVATHRLASNPFTRLPKANEKADPRRQRRTLTEPEIVALLDAARRRPLADYGRTRTGKGRKSCAVALSPDTLGKAEAEARRRLAANPGFIAELDRRGRERALLYKLLVLTGLRANEARSLTVGSLDLDPANPYIVLKAADAKTREAAEIPLRADLASDLTAWASDKLQAVTSEARAAGEPIPARLPPDTPLIDVPTGLVRILNRDMVAAGIATMEHRNGKRYIAKRDERGRSFDVHGFRHTFNSLLAAADVPQRTRQVLMRHASSGTLTDDIYSDPKVLDLRGALDKLPALPLQPTPNAERMRATGTAGSDDSGFQFRESLVAPTVAPTVGKSCHSSRFEGIAGTVGENSNKHAASIDTAASVATDKGNKRVTTADRRLSKWSRWGSNPRPLACHASALPTELRPRVVVRNAPSARCQGSH